jgi:predicted Zn-dependent protease
MELERALRYDPNHPEIHRALATLNWEAGNVQRARVAARWALDADPADGLAFYVIGRCEAAAGSTGAAVAAFRTALLCSDPEKHLDLTVLCHYYLAEALAKEGYLEAALQQYSDFETAAAELDEASVSGELDALPRIPSRHAREDRERILGPAGRGSAAEARSAILERLWRFSEAADALAPKAADSPNDAALGVRYARLLARAERFDDALEAARAIPSDDDTVIRLLEEIHELAGRPEAVIDDLRSRLTARPDDAGLALALGEALMRFNRAGEARQELQQYLHRHPEADLVRAKLVEVLSTLSAWPEALEISADRLLRHPDDPGQVESKIRALASNEDATARLLGQGVDPGESFASLYLRGVLAAAAGRLEKAERLLSAALSKRDRFLPARAALARVYLRLYRYDDALRTAGRAEEDVAQDARLERVLGEVYERLDELDEAELHFRAAVQLDRADTDAMLALARLHHRRGHRLQAMRQLRVLLQDYPMQEAARELLAVAYLQDGKLDAAVEEFEELRKLATTSTTKARCEAIVQQFRTRDSEAYRQTLLDAMEHGRPDADTWIAIAESYNRFDEAADVRRAHIHALAIDPENEEAVLGLVDAERRLLAFEEAAKHLEALLPRRPNRHSWRLELIELYWNIQDYDAALALAAKQEARSDLSDAAQKRYRLAIAGTLQLAGRTEEAVKRLEAWAEVSPDDPEWPLRLAREYLRLERTSDAVSIYETVYESDPELLYDLVDALVEAEQYDRAGQLTLERLHDDPDSDDAVSRLAYVLAVGERREDAIEILRNKLLHSLNREQLQTLLIRHLRSADKHEEAIDFAAALIDEVLSIMHQTREQAPRRPADGLTDEEIARRPDEPFTMQRLHDRLVILRLELVRSLFAAEELRRAEHKLTTWIDEAREPSERAEYLNSLADCYQLRGDETRANETWERVLAIVPDGPGLNNNVAYSWIDRGVRMNEAERMIRYALWRQPRQPAYIDTYGWLLYKKGSPAEAKKWLERAKGRMPQPDPVVFDHLGDTCWRLGQTSEAIEYWGAALEALGAPDDEGPIPADRRRVRDRTQQKIDDALAGGTPEVEPLAVPEVEEGSTPGDAGP